jgi:iron(III) transport system ATP-binding protein
MSELRISSVTKSFGTTVVLRDVDLLVADGSLTALLGTSGSGKTTLLRIIAGFERADAGSVAIAGEIVADEHRAVSPERRHVGYVPQEGALFPHLSVAENIGFGVLERRARKARVSELLELIDLAALADRRPHELSGGQRQRVALARALAPAPKLLLLDEPFSSLDPKTRYSLSEDVIAALRETHTTAVLVTHDQDEALSLADRVAILREGRIVQWGTPRELYEEPGDPEIASFVGVGNFLSGTALAGDTIATSLGVLSADRCSTLVAGEDVTVLVRPEQLRIAQNGTNRARVLRSEFHGHDALVYVELLDTSPDAPLSVMLRANGHEMPEAGEELRLQAFGPVRAWSASSVDRPVAAGARGHSHHHR